MDNIGLKKEDPIESSKAILHFITETYNQTGTYNHTLFRDLCWKISKIDGFDKTKIVADTFFLNLPNDLKQHFEKEAFYLNNNGNERVKLKKKMDVGILTVIDKELKAVLTVLGIQDQFNKGTQIGKFKYWFKNVDRPGSTPLSVVVTMVGEARNVPCALAVEHLTNEFDVDLLMLIGIAAGPKSKVKLGDVVCGSRVYDYEHMRLEVNRTFKFFKIKRSRPRPEYFSLRQEMKIALQQYDKSFMESTLSKVLDNLDDSILPIEKALFKPDFCKATIASGEKLFADGSLSKMYELQDERIRAGTQDDSGFSQSAILKDLPWCIFRGICDYGDPRKADNWHFGAALSAAAAGVSFLEYIWKY